MITANCRQSSWPDFSWNFFPWRQRCSWFDFSELPAKGSWMLQLHLQSFLPLLACSFAATCPSRWSQPFPILPLSQRSGRRAPQLAQEQAVESQEQELCCDTPAQVPAAGWPAGSPEPSLPRGPALWKYAALPCCHGSARKEQRNVPDGCRAGMLPAHHTASTHHWPAVSVRGKGTGDSPGLLQASKRATKEKA